MPKSDLLQASAPRAELDQRSRDARLRLEHVERSLVVAPLPKQPLLRRVLGYLGWRIYAGGQAKRRSAKAKLTGGRPRQRRRMPGATGGAAGSSRAAPFASPPNCPRYAGMSSGRSDLAAPSRSPTVRGEFAVLSPWDSPPE